MKNVNLSNSTKANIINSVVNADNIEITFNHVGTPAWTSETWQRQKDGHFKCVHEEASNFNFDASGEVKCNKDMIKYIRKCNKTTDCEVAL